MKVSVIVPAHNAAGTLADTLASLRAQTFVDWEAIVIDDGSSDDTAAIATRFAGQDHRIRFIVQPRSGVSAARNAGLRLARCDWLLFLDADDWILPSHLERLTTVVSADPALDAVYCGWRRVAPDGTLLGEPRPLQTGDLFAALARAPVFVIHACLVRRALVEAAGGFDPSLHVCQDWDLWQRLARTGARFGAIPDILAHYRMRPNSVSVAGHRFFAEGLRVTTQGHASDPRVPNPKPAHANGQPAEQLASARLHFACWPAGLLLGSGEDAHSLLERLKDDRAPDLDPHTVAQCLFEAALIPTCQTPAAWVELWPRLEARLHDFLLALEAHSTTPALARRAGIILERLITTHAATVEPLTVGRTHAVRVEATHPIPDLTLPAFVERLQCVVELEGTRLGLIELPVCDGFMPAYVLADAIAAEFAWPILGRFFERTVYRDLRVERGPAGLSLWRGALCLAAGLAGDERMLWPSAHDHIGWTVFLQELWARPDWANTRFYDDSGAVAEPAPRRRADDGWWVVEISDDVPEVETTSDELQVVMTVGGVAIGRVSIPVKGKVVPAHALRAALTNAGGFELCRVAVREGLVGQSLDGGASLRERLAAVAARHAQAQPALPDAADIAPGSARAVGRAWGRARGVMLGQRAHAAWGTSVSRPAALPAGAVRELVEAASVAGELVIQFDGSEDQPERVIYAPDLIARASSSPRIPRENQSRAVQRGGAAAPHDRHYFESLFARQPDPWRYTTPYEQTKYEQTLAMLPAGKIVRALELACAEGHFTLQLAPRVENLIAADIAEVALAHAAERCATLKNVRFMRLDLSHDPLPKRFDLIVCSEVLYYVGGRQALREVARKLADALNPGGGLVMAHAHMVADDPGHVGYDWDVPFGAKVIGETFSQTPSLQLVKEVRAPLYRVQLFRREPEKKLPFRRTEAHPQIVEMLQPTPIPPHLAVHVRWQGDGPTTETLPVVTHELPILIYHRVASGDSPALARYRVTPEVFEAQLSYLHEAGYYSVGLDDWRAAMEARRPLPGRAVLITFDDGYMDFLTHAWPLLKRYGFSATVFLVADHIGGFSLWDQRFGETVSLLGWREICRLEDEGVEFGSHSANHPWLTALSHAEVVREGARARAILERGLGVPVRAFSYPYGDVDPAVERLIGGCGYVFGLTCRPVRSTVHDSLLDLPRLEVTGSDNLPAFIAKLGA